MCKEMKLTTIYEELSTILVIDLEQDLPLIISKDPLERTLVGHEVYGDAEENKMIQIIDVVSVFIHKGSFDL